MKLLQELFAISESEIPGNGDVELKDLVKYFPNTHAKAIQKMWGSHRLMYNGKSLSDGTDSVINSMEVALKRETEENNLEMHVEFSSIEFVPVKTDEEELNPLWIDINFDCLIKHGDYQRVWLGFDPKTEKLIAGYDCWLDEDDFNEHWDAEFKEETGFDFDYEIENHKAAFTKAFEEFKTLMAGHFIAEFTDNGSTFEVSIINADNKLFYPVGYAKVKSRRLIELHAD